MNTLPRLTWSEHDHEAVRKRLAAHHVVTVALLESATLDEALGRILAGLGEALGWDAGVLWKPDEARNALGAVSSWRPPSRGSSGSPSSTERLQGLAPGLAEHARARREPVWMTAMPEEPVRDALAEKPSVASLRPIRSAVAFPAIAGSAGGEVAAVFELLSCDGQPPDPEVGQTLASLGYQIGLYAEGAAAREAVRVGEARKAAIVECALDCIVSIDREGNITEFNPAAERTFGYRRDAVLGRPMASLLIAPSLREQHRRGFAHYLATGESAILGRRIETTAVRADGTEFPIELTVTLIVARESPAFTAFIRDVSERTRLRELEREAAERAEAGSRLLRAVVDCSPDAIFAKDLQGRYFLINSKGANGINFQVSEVVGRTDADLFPAESARAIRLVDEEVARTNRTETVEAEIAIGGRQVTFRSTTAPFIDEKGKTCGVIGVAVDVTESKRWQDALRESEQRLRTLLEASPDDPVQLKDPAGRWLEANRAALHLFGLEGVDYHGKTDAELSRIEGVDRDALQGCPDTDEVAWEKRERSRVEETIRTRDGTVRTFDVIKVPMFDDEGRRRELVVLARDITDRKRAEGERARSLEGERELRVAAEKAGRRAAFLAEASRSLTTSLDYGGMLKLAAELAVPFLARSCLVYPGVDEGGPRGCVVAPKGDPRSAALAGKLVDPASRTGAPEAARTGRSFLSDEPPTAASLGFREDARGLVEALGSSSVMIVPLVARGRTCGAMAFLAAAGTRFSAPDLELADEFARRAAMAIDNARLYDDAQRAIRVRDDFLVVASHELRTPCTSLTLGIQGLMRHARAGSLAAVPSAHLDVMLGACDRQIHQLNLLIDRLLDVARIQSDRLRLEPSSVDLAALTREAVDELANRAHGPIDLQGATAPVVGRWDRSRLQQMLGNLLSNAIKFGAGKPIEVRLEATGSSARLVVRDSGIGILPEYQQKVFGPFERAVSPREFAGLGLGLFIVRQIVAAHGGTIQIDSARGEGSTFTVELPRSAPAP